MTRNISALCLFCACQFLSTGWSKPSESDKIPRALLPRHPHTVTALAFSPDGTLIASGSSKAAILIREVSTGKKKLSLPCHDHDVSGLAFSPDGKRLASVGRDMILRIWDTITGRQLQALKELKSPLLCVAFSPDGKTMAAGSANGSLGIWHPGTEKKIHVGKTSVEKITALAFMPDGKNLLCGGIVTEQEEPSLRFSQPAPVFLWNLENGKEVRKLPVRGSSLALTSDGKVLVTGGMFRFFAARNYKGWAFLGSGANGKPFIQSTKIYWWDLEQEYEIARFQNKGSGVAFSPDGQFLFTGGGNHGDDHWIEWGTNLIGGAPTGDPVVRLWDVQTGSPVLQGKNASATAIAFASDGRTLAWGEENGAVMLWDLRLPKPEKKSIPLQKLWADLGSTNFFHAHKAHLGMAATPEKTVAFLKEHLAPIPISEDKRIRKWVNYLDNPEIILRELAVVEMKKLGKAGELALQERLKTKVSLEGKRRIEALLESLQETPPSEEERRALRGIQVLQRIGSPEARKLLEDISQGSPLALQTLKAREALRRVRKDTGRK